MTQTPSRHFRNEGKREAARDGFAGHDVLGYLLDHRSELSRSHGRIVDAILHQPTAFVEKPIEELVTWLGISAPTITRFSRAIGCDGLRDLKLKVMSSVLVGSRYLEPVTPPDTLAEACERVVRRAQHAIAKAHRTPDPTCVEEAVGDQVVKATCADPEGLAPGAALTLAAPGHAVHLFDRASGNRLGP